MGINKRILIAVPTYETIYPETFKSIYDLKNSLGVKLDFEFVKGYDCARARNLIAKKAIEGGYDNVLMVDSDIILPDNVIDRFARLDYDMFLGYSPRKNDPTMAEIYKDNHFGYDKENRYSVEELERLKDSVDLIKINGGSFGCAYIKTDIFNHLHYPYFQYINYPNGQLLSEDLYFCSEVRNKHYRIYLDPKVRCRHIGKRIV